MSRSTLVLFDIDGTLMRGAGVHHKEALLEGVKRVTGRQASFDGIDTAGKLDMDLIGALLHSTGALAGTEVLEAIAEQSQLAYVANCLHDLRRFVCRGVRELMETLALRDAALGLVTGNLSAIGWRKMELAGLKEFFHCGAFSEDAPTRAEIAQLAAVRARQRNHAAADCRVSLIGDHRNDIEAAKANGIRSVAVASGPMPAAELRSFAPDILVDTLADLDVNLLFG
jgi:phosphoglycolate phosphatase-like HAD superfamily hydrolase